MEAVYALFNDPIELAGVITGIICVWLNARENIWGWFFAIISCGLYIHIFYRAKIYGEVLLQIYYIVVSVYGWYHWKFGGQASRQLPVTLTPTRLRFVLLLIFGLGAFSFGYYLDRYTDSEVPYVDASTNAMSLIAQWMMARKYLENWLVWLVADVIYVGLFFYKDLQLTAILYLIFLGLATMGYFSWRRSYRES